MRYTETRAWWADVEHLQDRMERRNVDPAQADRDDLATRREARARRAAELEAARVSAGLAAGDDWMGTDRLPRGRRFERREDDFGWVDGRDRDPLEDAYERDAYARQETSEGPVLDQVHLLEDIPVAEPARRTVEIKGHPDTTAKLPTDRQAAATHGSLERRRPPRRAVERVGHRPDHVALWALLMGVMLIVVAYATG